MAIALSLAVSAAGYANQPVDPRLDFTASSLAFAANQLVVSVRQAQGDSHIEQDAETLYEAAEHFKEEVELGPEDLDIDFKEISETFGEMREELASSYLVRENAQVRGSWFNTEESWIRLRQAWLAHCEPGTSPGPTPTPFPHPTPGPGPFPHPTPGPVPFPQPTPFPGTTSVDCGSSRYRYRECPVSGRIVSARLVQRLSGAPCVEGQSFGFLPGAVWVNRGCHAIFSVSTQY